MSAAGAGVPALGQLRINGFFLIRAGVEPARGEQSSRSWELDVSLLGEPGDANARFFLFGKLRAVDDSRMVRVVVGSGLDLPSGTNPQEQDLETLRAACSQLFEETLWDATASFARPIAAMAAIRGLEIPMQCPKSPSVWKS